MSRLSGYRSDREAYSLFLSLDIVHGASAVKDEEESMDEPLVSAVHSLACHQDALWGLSGTEVSGRREPPRRAPNGFRLTPYRIYPGFLSFAHFLLRLPCALPTSCIALLCSRILSSHRIPVLHM